MTESKSGLRKIYSEKLAKTDQSWLDLENLNLVQQVRGFLASAGVGPKMAVLAWLPFFYGEPSLLSLQQDLKHKFFFPRMEGEHGMRFYNSDQFVADGLKGLSQPIGKDENRLDLASCRSAVCFVPGLAFDRKGFRLGRGKGMYDRFLAAACQQTDLKKVGVCWSFQIADFLPADDHDQKIDVIITELGVTVL